MQELSDNELFELIKRSSYPAYNELYRRHWKYIYGIAYKKTLDKDDAFDLTQNVFMEFYDKREKLVINLPLKNFLRTAIIYKLAKYFRTRGFQERHYLNFQQFLSQAQEAESLLDSLEIKEAEMKFEEMVELVYQAIDEMPEKMKEVFLMSRSEQYSITEIADKLNISPQTVKNQVSKALSRIRVVAETQKVPVTQLLILLWLTKS